MLKLIYGKRIGATWLMACCLLLLVACSESSVNAPAEKQLVTFKVVLPQDEVHNMDAPESRAGGNTGTVVGDESKIESLQFFVFDGVSNTFETYATSVGNPMWDAATRTIRITVTQGKKKIYCLANWTDGVNGMTAAAGLNTIAALGNLTRTHAASTTMMPPVMTGYLEPTITGSVPLTIQLVRQIARVELAFKLSDVLAAGTPAAVQITGVKFLKLPSASFALPKTASPAAGTWSSAYASITNTGALTGTSTGFDATKFYLPEFYPASSAAAAVMVIKAKYNGVDSYYRIVLDPAESPQNGTYNHPANVIERNHTYQYTITVDGIGEASDITTRGGAMGNSANITYKLDIK